MTPPDAGALRRGTWMGQPTMKAGTTDGAITVPRRPSTVEEAVAWIVKIVPLKLLIAGDRPAIVGRNKMKSKEDFKPKTIEQYQKEIIDLLSKMVEPYSPELPFKPAFGIAMDTDNYGFDFPYFLDALDDLVKKGIVEKVKRTITISTETRYQMAGANRDLPWMQ